MGGGGEGDLSSTHGEACSIGRRLNYCCGKTHDGLIAHECWERIKFVIKSTAKTIKRRISDAFRFLNPTVMGQDTFTQEKCCEHVAQRITPTAKCFVIDYSVSLNSASTILFCGWQVRVGSKACRVPSRVGGTARRFPDVATLSKAVSTELQTVKQLQI